MRLHDVGRGAVALALDDQCEAAGFGAREILKVLLFHGYQLCTDMKRESHSRGFRYRSILMVMSHPRTPRLKLLLDTVPPGFVVDTPWLKARGIDSKSIHDYVARGWLERIARGVYRPPFPVAAQSVDREESWAILLLSLQRLMNYAVHLGAESALDVAGQPQTGPRSGEEAGLGFQNDTSSAKTFRVLAREKDRARGCLRVDLPRHFALRAFQRARASTARLA